MDDINVFEISQKELNVKFVDYAQQSFYFHLIDIRKEIQLYKKKRTIKVINKDDKEKEYEIYWEEQISYIQEREGLTIKNSQIYDSKDNIITNLKKIARIDYIKSKEYLNPFDKYKLKKANKKYQYTLNFDTYFSTKNFQFIETKERKELNDKLFKFLNDENNNIIGLTGI